MRSAFFELFNAAVALGAALLNVTPTDTELDMPSSERLPFFLELYLSLVVAAADERTSAIGNYRRRLAASIGVGEAALLHHDLPKLWELAAEWTNRTSLRNVARLVLPDPGGERIIGVSKRLSFPNFADQQRLASLLAERELDDASPLTDILHEVGESLGTFSAQFQTEFRIFREQLQTSGFVAAAQTPFWHALRETSGGRTAKDRLSQGSICLELDPSDPYAADVIATCARGVR